MKKIIVIIALLAASGCSLIPLMQIRPYDPVEYELAVSTTVNATRAVHRCGDTTSPELWNYIQAANTDTFVLDEFVKNKDESTIIFPVVDIVRSSMLEILDRGTFSSVYCVDKLTNIQAESRILERILGNTDRYNMCDGGILSRYNRFKADYDDGKLSEIEFKDLTNDLIKLGKIDKSGCTNAVRVQMINDIETIKTIVSALK